MLFNSVPFLIFFVVFFALYWSASKKLRLQNILILVGSYIFYAWWDWRFLALLAGSSAYNYVFGLLIHRTVSEKKRKLFVGLAVTGGLGTLIIYKYLNFFIASFHIGSNPINLILPLGISFYTFRTISYILDIDKNKIEPVRDWVVFFSYVSFFPSLIAGPIDKAKTLVPQLEDKRTFEYHNGTDGLRQILWGLFKKLVIADNCASITNSVYDNFENLNGSTLFIAACLYSVQIYADFSGYSDMAIGIARLLGFNITRNFEFPFFAQNIADFWRKWHISLTGWLTEYLFTPLTIAFRNLDKAGMILAILINFTLIGVWHGANWTFILFGFIHGCLFIPLILKNKLNKKNKIAKDQLLPKSSELLNMLKIFLIVTLTFILFRSADIKSAGIYVAGIFTPSFFSQPHFENIFTILMITTFTLLMFAVEWKQRDKQHALQFSNSAYTVKTTSKSFRWSIYVLLVLLIIGFSGKEQDFIYIQF